MIISFLTTRRLQEIIDDDQRETGRIPRTVECELTSDLGIFRRNMDTIVGCVNTIG